MSRYFNEWGVELGARQQKAALRQRLLAARRDIPAATLEEASYAIGGHLRRLLADLTSQRRSAGPRLTIAGYVPVNREPGGATLPELLATGGRLLLPVLQPDLDLDWAEFTGQDGLTSARLGLLEPSGPALGLEAVSQAQLVVVPAVAVDWRGVRLGRGGGSYDRVLARPDAGALTVALLYENELLEEVPAERHDRQVHAVITPAGYFRLR